MRLVATAERGEDGASRAWECGHAPTSLWLSVCLAQFSLLSEVRGVISPQDLDRFDNLVLKREIESMKARQPSGPSVGTDSYSMMSYSDTVSSSSSHFTSTTVSSARVSLFQLFLFPSTQLLAALRQTQFPQVLCRHFPQHEVCFPDGFLQSFFIPLQAARAHLFWLQAVPQHSCF